MRSDLFRVKFSSERNSCRREFVIKDITTRLGEEFPTGTYGMKFIWFMKNIAGFHPEMIFSGLYNDASLINVKKLPKIMRFPVKDKVFHVFKIVDCDNRIDCDFPLQCGFNVGHLYSSCGYFNKKYAIRQEKYLIRQHIDRKTVYTVNYI